MSELRATGEGDMPDENTGPLRESSGVTRGTPEWDAEIRDCVDACDRDPSYESRVIEPLAGFFWPQVKADMDAVRRLREQVIAAFPATGKTYFNERINDGLESP